VASLFSKLWQHCSKEAKPTENFFSDIVAELFKAHPEFLCRGVLQPVLDSMRDFQRWFKFPWEEQTLAQNEISDTQKMNTPDAQLTQNEL
jgi:hypothetical protein